MAERSCVICGGVFAAAPSSRTATCSKPCSSEHRGRTHIGKRNKWGDTSAARAAADRTGNLSRGTAAASASPKAGPFESNINAKVWLLISPEGNHYKARNLRLWCETNADLFVPHRWQNAYAGLRQVSQWLAGRRKTPAPAWRGWTLKETPIG